MRNNNNPQCPYCGAEKTHKHGKRQTTPGDQRYRCPTCEKTFRIDKKTHCGPPPIGWRPMTNAERQRRWYVKRRKRNNGIIE